MQLAGRKAPEIISIWMDCLNFLLVRMGIPESSLSTCYASRQGMRNMKIGEVGRKLWRLSQFIEQPRLFKVYKNLHRAKVSMIAYDAWNLDFFRQMQIRTVLDIGASVGETLALFHEIFAGVKVYCFEPLPESYAVLEKRVKWYPGSRAFNIAVGERQGILRFNRNDFPDASSALPLTPYYRSIISDTGDHLEALNEHPIEVEVRPLDDVSRELDLRPGVLLKIDVQGYEDRVLRGAAKSVLGKVSIMILEVSFVEIYRGQALFDDIYHQVTNLGFRFAGFIGEMRDPRKGSLLLQADALFVNDSPVGIEGK